MLNVSIRMRACTDMPAHRHPHFLTPLLLILTLTPSLNHTQVLESMGLNLARVKTFVGTSAGSISAATGAVGHTSDSMLVNCQALDYKRLVRMSAKAVFKCVSVYGFPSLSLCCFVCTCVGLCTIVCVCVCVRACVSAHKSGCALCGVFGRA